MDVEYHDRRLHVADANANANADTDGNTNADTDAHTWRKSGRNDW